MDEDVLDEISKRTMLSIDACRDMFDGGWMFVEELSGKMRWEKNRLADLKNTAIL